MGNPLPNPTQPTKLAGLPKPTQWYNWWLFYFTQTGVPYMIRVLGLTKPNPNRPMYTPTWQHNIKMIKSKQALSYEGKSFEGPDLSRQGNNF